MATPHISAALGDFASTVLFPGDPLRAKFIAENFLTEVRQVTAVRNILGFTGLYRGRAVSVMGSGMGIPSCSIYAHELYAFYGVESIIRVGSCGAFDPNLNLGDVVLAMAACTDSQVNRLRFGGYDFAASADFSLLQQAVFSAKELGKSPRVGRVFSSDTFYGQSNLVELMGKMQVLGVEMEAAGLYGVASYLGKKALAILSVSDHVVRKEEMSSDQRERGLSDMIRLALETAFHSADVRN